MCELQDRCPVFPWNDHLRDFAAKPGGVLLLQDIVTDKKLVNFPFLVENLTDPLVTPFQGGVTVLLLKELLVTAGKSSATSSSRNGAASRL